MIKLNKDIVRETDVLVDDKPLIITITSDQKILIRQKGKSKDNLEIEISIEKLFSQITKSSLDVVEEDNVNINLHLFRSKYLTDGKLGIEAKKILEQITVDLLKE